MAQPWERDWSVQPATDSNKKPWERQWQAPQESDSDPAQRSVADTLKDTGISLLKGAIAVPEAVTGLADIATLGRAGKALEEAGFRPGEAKKMLDEMYSPAQQAANKAVQSADGFVPTAVAALQNPSTIVQSVAESLPLMGAGGVVGRGIMAAAPKAAAWLAGGLGEGVIGAGSAASQIRGETSDKLLTPGQAAIAAASGAGTAALGAAGGKIAAKMGVADVDTMLAQGGMKALKSPAGFVKAVVGGGISEGVFEELPQSVQEQMWQNYALDKPLTEGVGNAAAMGLITGAAMGGAGGGFSAAATSFKKLNEPPPDAPATEPTGTPVNAAEILGEVQRDSTEISAPNLPAAPTIEAPTAAEKALAEPKRLTDLDRVQEIDKLVADMPPEDPQRDTLTQERARLASSFPKVTPGQVTSFSTEAGAKVDGQYALVEADDLQTSHDANLRPNPAYPAELQPRDRTRAASETQIAGIVGKLDPARLGVSADAATGAPIIGADGLVESGNARTIALKRIYSANGQKAIDYKAFLRENAAQFGLTTEQIEGAKQPVLVRVRTTPVNRAEFARQANASTVAMMSPSEQAKSDASRIDVLDDLQPTEDGDFATSRDFIRRFVGRLPNTEQSGMIDAGGRLSSAGYARVRNAVLAKAYGDSPILTRMVESMDDNLRNVSKALLVAAPRVAQARSLIQAGRLHDADVTPHLITAVEELGRLKESGTSVADALSQIGLEGEVYSPETRDFLGFMSENMRKPKKMAEFVTAYFDALEAMGDPNQASMFGDAPAPSTGELLTAARRTTTGEPNATSSATQDAVGRDAGKAAQDGQGTGGEPASAKSDSRGNEGNGKPAAVAANDESAAGIIGAAAGSPARVLKKAADEASESSRISRSENQEGVDGNDKPVTTRPAATNFVDGDWRLFDEASGTLGIPRAEMPQVKVKRRPALYEFLADRGITNKRETVSAGSLKPTQAEYSRDKADRAAELLDEDSDRQIVLASSDDYVLDGHHRWVSAQEAGRDVEIVRLDAPIAQLLKEVPQFPGATTSDESAGQTPLTPRETAVQDLKDGLADLGMILSKHQRAAMVPESTPGLMPTLVNITGAALRVVGTDLRAVVAWVRAAMKADAKLKPLAAKVPADLIRKAAVQAMADLEQQGSQMGLFDAKEAQDLLQGDLFAQQPAEAVTAAAMSEITKAAKADSDIAQGFGFAPWPMPLPDSDLALRETSSLTVTPDGRPRAELHAEIVRQHLEGILPPEGRKPIAYVMGGGGASGKGTLKKALIKSGRINDSQAVVLDPDEIKAMIPEWDVLKRAGDARAARFTHEESSAISKQVLKASVDKGVDIVYDVTLGNRKKGVSQLQALKDAGYEVRLFGVSVDVATAVRRADSRARKNGRYVPIEALLEAHKGFTAAFDDYAKIVDEASLFENTENAKELASFSNGVETILDRLVYDQAVERSVKLNENARSFDQLYPGSDGARGVAAQQSGGGLDQQALERDRGGLAGGDARSQSQKSGLDRVGNEATQGRVGVNDADPATDGGNGAEGAAARAARQPQGKRRPAPVRDGTGEPDLFSSGQPDAGAADQAELGSAGPDGVRQADANGRPSQSRGAARRGAGVPAGADIGAKSGRNYRFTDADLSYEGSWFKKAEQNVAALELVKRLDEEGRQATPEEQSVLAKWIGWGASELANKIFSPASDKKEPAFELYQKAKAAAEGQTSIGTMDPLYWQLYQRLSFIPGQSRLSYREAIPVSRITPAAFDLDSDDARWLGLRAKIKGAMTAEQWAEARRTTQYAHFTSKGVVRGIWAGVERMGFKGGTMLEPGAGNGIFPGLMPEAMAINSSYTGIEYDTFTGKILKHLQPDERILIESFIDSKLPKNFFDLGVGNPPFQQKGAGIISDPTYRKYAFPLHDYFFAKTIDSVKPGGLLFFVTSRYTMDKLDDKARKYLAERADLVGAIRLPQTAFKQNAGTEVVTDVLFLRKKVPGETFEQAQPWLKTAEIKTKDGKQLMVSGGKDRPDRPAMVNEYFAAHPEMVLGEHSNTGSMYSDKEYTVSAPVGDIEDLFNKAVLNLPADIYTAKRGSAAEAAKVREIDFNPKAQKEGNYYVNDKGVLMQRENGVGQAVFGKKPDDVTVIKAFVPVRDALKQAHYDQLNDGDWEKSLAALNKEYAGFVAKHGRINQFVTKTVRVKVDELDDEGTPTGKKLDDEEQRRVYPMQAKLQDDPDWTLVFALEKVNDDTGEIAPSAFLTGRVLGKPAAPQIQSAHDAMLSVLNDMGKVDMAAIAQRLDMSEEDAAESLGSAVYRDPEGDWTTADEYLSGNVKRKLEVAKAAAKADRRMERNVEALETAQPAPKGPAQISAGIGMNWIPGSDYAQFLSETAGVRSSVAWNEATRQWVVKHDAGYGTARAIADWGTGSRHAGEILEHALTGRPIRVTKSIGNGSDRKTIFDADATEAANDKLDKMRAEFETWLWKDADRANRLVQSYNDKFNTTVARSFDGRHLSLPGSSQQFHIFDHVKRGAWRIVQSGNTYLAHAVGSGKTFQMVISAMEQKRLGIIKKPMVVVPNHMLGQFAREWQELYPAARLMVADEANFHTDNRRRFVSRVALSDLDGVVITHSAFKMLDLDPEFKAKIINEQLDYMRAALEEAEDDEGKGNKRSPRIKQIEKQIENLEEKLKAALDGSGKDKNARFDELGVDMVYVDEAHEFRKLDFATARQVKGIQPAGSQRALDLYIKARYLEEKRPGRSLVMASGTPITNTLAELYTVQRFMGNQALVERGIEDFDSWAAMFGREKTDLEPNAAGKYEPVTRFSKFVNVPELTQMFREYADVVTSDQLASMLGDKRPKVDGGSRNIIITPKSAAYSAYQKELEQRVQTSRDWKPSKDEPNNPDPIIKIIGDGRLAAIDMRFINPALISDPNSKLNRLADDLIAKFKETADVEYLDKAGKAEPAKGSTMMVFSDLGFGAGVAASRGFNGRAWLEKRMRDAGVPLNQVAFMSDYKKSAEKLKLFKDVNAGRIRVLIGSSKNMGTGVNAQQRLKAMFHLDSPWYPSDLEQREGRIIRQGNKNKLVQIYAYAAKGTYDENMWKMLASKQFFIDQALNGDENLREIEDLDSQSQYDMAAAMVADDPRVMQLAGAKAEIDKLQRLFRAHEDQRMKFTKDYRFAQDTVTWGDKELPLAEEAAAKIPDLSGDNFVAKVGKTKFTERAEWGKAIAEAAKALNDKMADTQTIGEIAGFEVRLIARRSDSSYSAHVEVATPEARMLMLAGVDASPMGLAMTSQNAVADVARKPARIRDQISRARAQMDAVRERLNAPFSMSEMLSAKMKEVADLEQALQARDWYVQAPDGKEYPVKANGAQQAIDKIKETNPGLAGTDLTAKEAKSTDDPFGTKLSRGGGGGMTIAALRSVADAVVARLPGLPPVKVLSSPAAAPQALRDYIERRGAMADAEGALHGGTIYLFASGIQDALRAEHVLADHEAAHAGLQGLLGDGVKQAMTAIYNQNPAVMRKAKALMQSDKGLTLAGAVEEVIVDIPSADLAKLKGWRGLVERMRDALKAKGFERLAAWLDGLLAAHTTQQQRADLAVAALVREARTFVSQKRAKSMVDDAARQEKWLADKAKAAGYADIDALAAADFGAFEKLAEEWRQKNPAAALLSRAGQAPTADTAADRAEAIIQKPASTPKPLDAVSRLLTHRLGIERLGTMLYDKGGKLIDTLTPERIKAGVVSDYGVPEAVLDQRARMQGAQRVQLHEAGKLIDKLTTLTRAESRVAYEWMSGDDTRTAEDLMKDLPEASVKVLLDVRVMIDDLSKEAVRLGQLEAEAFKRHRFEYLRRSYFKHASELTESEKTGRQRAISILGDQYKGRGMTIKAPMAKIQNIAPEWWKRKFVAGKADTSLKGEKFLRLERRVARDASSADLPGMDADARKTKLAEVVYWPEGEAIPTRYSEWEKAGSWEVRDTVKGDLVLWRDFTKAERVKMGEIDEARYAIGKTLHRMVHDIEVGRYLEWLSQNHARKPGESFTGKIVEASERYRDAFTTDEWVQVPDAPIPGTSAKKYGKLAGMYLPGPIWNDLRQVVGAQRIGPEWMRTMITWWKTSKTALSPGVHTNNIMSNFVMADWHDVNATHVAKSLRIILAARTGDGKGLLGRTANAMGKAGIADREAAQEIVRRYENSGGAIGGWVTQEIANDQLAPIVDALKKEVNTTLQNSMPTEIGIYSALQHVMHARFPAAWEAFKGSRTAGAVATDGKNLIDLYQAEDDVFRLAAWLKAKEQGLSDADAGKKSRKSFLDYQINAPWVAMMRQTALPFVSFTYRAVPMLIEIAAKKPHKIFKLMMLGGMLGQLGVLLGGGGDDEERKLLPEEKAGRLWGMVPKLIRMPWNDTNGSPVYLDVRRWVPAGDVLDLGQGHAAMPWPPFLMPGGPLALIGEIFANKSMFTGKDITLATDTTTEKAAKIADHLWKSLMPNIIGLPGSYATEGVMGAAKGRTDAFGREMSVPMAVGSAMGVKLGAYPADVLRRNIIAKRNAEVNEIDMQISALKRRRQTNQIDAEDYEKEVTRHQEKKAKVMADVAEKMR